MIQHTDGHVSLLVHFRPREVRAAAERLAAFLVTIDDVVVTLDVNRGNLELANVRGVDLRVLTDWLYRRGARCVFVRYEHEGRCVSIAYGSDDGKDPLERDEKAARAVQLN
jgi:hypothetical protein